MVALSQRIKPVAVFAGRDNSCRIDAGRQLPQPSFLIGFACALAAALAWLWVDAGEPAGPAGAGIAAPSAGHLELNHADPLKRYLFLFFCLFVGSFVVRTRWACFVLL